MDGFPQTNGTMPAGPAQLHLRFNSRIDIGRSRLLLVLPDHHEQLLTPRAGSTPDIMLADATLVPGPHRLNWQVLAVDGHITRGSLTFMAVAK